MVARRAERTPGHRDEAPAKTSVVPAGGASPTGAQTFTVGQHVLHSAHGEGEITALEQVEINGQPVEVLAISFPADKVTLRVPLAKAASLGIRALPASEPAAEAPLVPAPRLQPSFLDELQRHGYSEDEIFELVIPKRTLARRRAEDDLLTVEETDKAVRLDRIAALADRVFGDHEKAHRWLRKPKRQLAGETPLAYLASESGARVVEEMLYRIDHGMAA